jgi:hypothetical protein
LRKYRWTTGERLKSTQMYGAAVPSPEEIDPKLRADILRTAEEFRRALAEADQWEAKRSAIEYGSHLALQPGNCALTNIATSLPYPSRSSCKPSADQPPPEPLGV